MRKLRSLLLACGLALATPALAADFPIVTTSNGLRSFIATVSTASDGSWNYSFPYTFTSYVIVEATAISADTTLANSATATITAESLTAVSGYVNLPVTLGAAGGSPIQRAGSGIKVNVYVQGL